jgi:hypothetical protein
LVSVTGRAWHPFKAVPASSASITLLSALAIGGAAASAGLGPAPAGIHVHPGEVGVPAQGFRIEGVASLKRLDTRSDANRPEVQETL